MKRTQMLTLSLLTLTMIAATVWLVRAENTGSPLTTLLMSATPLPEIAIESQFSIGAVELATAAPYHPDEELPVDQFTEFNQSTPNVMDPANIYPTPGWLTEGSSTASVPTYPVGYNPTRSPQPTATGVNAPTSTPAKPTPTSKTPSTRTATAVPSPTALTQSGWTGAWTVWFEQDDGSYISGDVTFSVSNDLLIGSGLVGGVQYEFEILAFNEQGAEGFWNAPSRNGYLRWHRLTVDQFGGSRDDRFGFCGARPGLKKPEDCKILPLS